MRNIPSLLRFVVKLSPILAIWLSFSACASFQLSPSITPLKEKTLGGKGPEKVLLVDIQGLISNLEKRSLTGSVYKLGMVERVQEILNKAEEDDKIKAILLRINSPGGTVTSSDIIYHSLKAYKAKTKAKIYVSIMDLGASGGYYIAMAGDKVLVHPTSLVGSIGVIALKINLEELLNKIGVDWEVIKSADKKDFLSPLRPLTPEERKLFQEAIDSYHNRFVEIIAENRPELDVEQVRKLADGRVFTAQQALDASLVDKIGYMDSAIDLIKEEMGIADPELITYHRKGEYKSNLYSSMKTFPSVNMININLGLDLEKTAPNFMYLWMP